MKKNLLKMFFVSVYVVSLGCLYCVASSSTHNTSVKSPLDSQEQYVCKRCDGSGYENMTQTCPSCQGYGETKQSHDCSTCNGTGYITDKYGDQVKCSTCYGAGRTISINTCYNCSGTGSVKMKCRNCNGTGYVNR